MKRLIRYINIGILIFATLFTILSVSDVVERPHQIEYDPNIIKEHVEKMSKSIHSITNEEAHEEVYNYIINEIESYGFQNIDDTSKLAYVIHDTKINFNTSNSLSEIINGKTQKEKHVILNESFAIKNIVVSIPANSENKTNEAVMIMSHYDSVPMGPGASDDAVAVSVMLEAIKYYTNKIEEGFIIKNDLVFVFTDAEEYGLHGARAFIEEFNQLDNLLDRIKFAVNLESRGTSGTLIMFETSEKNYNSIKLFSKLNKNIFTSSIANMIYQNMPNGTDFSNYKHLYQGLNFANLGEGYNYHTQNDKFSNLSDTYLTQQATFIHDVIKETSNMNLNDLYQTNENAIFFSYLNLGTIFYSYTFGYILAIFAIILIISIVIIKIMKHNNTLIKTLKGYVVFLSAIFGSAIFAFILYYLFSYTAVLFNVIDIHSVGAVNFSSVPLVLCVIFISIILCAIITNYLIKLFKITGNDVRRSVSYVIGSIAIALSFALQVTSYLFIYAGIFLLMIELLSITIKKIDTDKLHLNLVVIGIISPIYLPMVFLSSDALGIDMSYAIAALSAIYAMLFIPNYLDSFEFFSISQIKNLIKKENKQIKPITGMISLLVLGVLILFIITSTKTNLSVNNLGKQNATMLPYDDALVYVIEEDNAHYLFKDLDAYPYLKNKLDGYTYNEQVNGYEKDDLNPLVSLTGLSNFNFSGNVLEIIKNNSDGFVEIVLEGNENISSLTVNYGHITETYDLKNSDKYVLRIRHNAIVTFNTIDNQAINAKITLYELLINYQPLREYNDFKNIVNIEQVKYNLINVTKLN